MRTVKISQAQAKEFARTILADIADYVKEHQEEYQEFLKEIQESKGDNED